MDEVTPDLGEVKQRVTAILCETFREVTVEFFEDTSDRLNGVVTTPDFSEIDIVDRQQLLRTAIRKGMGEDIRFVGMLFTSSPEETAALNELEPSPREFIRK